MKTGTGAAAGRPPERRAYRWFVLGLWMMAHVIAFVTLSVLGILLPAISKELGLSPAQQGLLGSSAQWGTLVLAIPIALWGSRYNPKLLTTLTLLAGAGLVFLQGWAPVFGVLLVGRFLFGISTQARRPAFAMLLQQWFTPGEAVLVNAVTNALFGVVLGAGYMVTPLILDAVGGSWRYALYAMGGASAALAALWMLLGRQRVTSEYSQRVQAQEGSPLRVILRHKVLWLCGLGLFSAQLAWAAFATFWPTLMLDRYDVSLRWSGNLLGINSICAAASGLAMAAVVATPGARKYMLIAMGLLLAGSMAALNLTGSLSALVALDSVNGLSWAFWPLFMALPFGLSGIRPREVAVSLAFFDTCLLTGSAAGPVVAGFLQEATGDIQTALVMTSMFCLGITVVGLLISFRQTSETREASSGWRPARSRRAGVGGDKKG